jgi:electron transfer flavoprotein alpha subunit
MKALVLAERSDACTKLCAGARNYADNVVLVVIGATEAPTGIADKTIKVSLPAGAVYDDAAATVAAVFDIEAPQIVIAEPTRHLKVVIGKLAAHANTAVITDVLDLSAESAMNMYFGGVAHRWQQPGSIAFYTIAPDSIAPAEVSGTDVVEEAAWVAPDRPLELLEVRPIEKSDVDLFGADTVVSAGRGFAEESELDLARELCTRLGAGFGCSRPLTEGLNWLPTSSYIGVSGLMLSPKVYVAIGISGQMQHMVGCNRAEVIFAINKDKNAPIFKQCDYGLVGDIKTVLPALCAAL